MQDFPYKGHPPLSTQIDLLLQAARANWREVEPAIFGTLLERALDPNERHALGAHSTSLLQLAAQLLERRA